jgi:Leucine-rich repeat (LRR) protein
VTTRIVQTGSIDGVEKIGKIDELSRFIKENACNPKAKKLAEQAHAPDYKELGQIDVLDLTGVGIESLPERLTDLTDLVVLDLTANQLQELPNSIVKMRGLRVLKLRGNRFQTVPPQLKEMKGLFTVDILENPIKAIPISLKDIIRELPYGSHWVDE